MSHKFGHDGWSTVLSPCTPFSHAHDVPPGNGVLLPGPHPELSRIVSTQLSVRYLRKASWFSFSRCALPCPWSSAVCYCLLVIGLSLLLDIQLLENLGLLTLIPLQQLIQNLSHCRWGNNHCWILWNWNDMEKSFLLWRRRIETSCYLFLPQ